MIYAHNSQASVCKRSGHKQLRTWNLLPSRNKEVVYNGWPTTVRELPSLIWPYWTYREELSIKDSLIFKATELLLHRPSREVSYPNYMPATKLRARTSVFWRNLSKNIEEMTKSCTICQELQREQAREPLIQTEVPPRPWHTVGTELTYFIFICLLTYWASLTLRTVQIQYCQPLNQSVQTQKLLKLSVQPQEQLSQSP